MSRTPAAGKVESFAWFTERDYLMPPREFVHEGFSYFIGGLYRLAVNAHTSESPEQFTVGLMKDSANV